MTRKPCALTSAINDGFWRISAAMDRRSSPHPFCRMPLHPRANTAQHPIMMGISRGHRGRKRSRQRRSSRHAREHRRCVSKRDNSYLRENVTWYRTRYTLTRLRHYCKTSCAITKVRYYCSPMKLKPTSKARMHELHYTLLSDSYGPKLLLDNLSSGTNEVHVFFACAIIFIAL